MKKNKKISINTNKWRIKKKKEEKKTKKYLNNKIKEKIKEIKRHKKIF